MAPRLSVVVPIHNVAPYLEACLDSLAAQSLTDLEVVMVDDGSTDNSGLIAEAYTRRDPRFRLIRQANAGLGAARNTGTRYATGTYLAFADSDDVVPEHAYELLAGRLDETGSDFATGNVRLLGSDGLTQSPMHRKPLGRTRLRTHVTRDRLLLYDRLAPNKVFRRSFWDRHRLAFPEGVLYEDIPVTIPAHFLARSVDVVDRPVYYWRQRVGANGAARSITQRRTEPQAVRDRIGAVTRVSRFLATRGHRYRRHKRAYDAVALGSDIRIFLNVLPEADAAFRHLFLELASEFLAQVAPGVVDELPAIMRLKWHLVARRRLPELLEVLAYERRGESIPTVRRRGRLYAAYPYFEDPELGVPRHVYRLRSELALRTRVTDVSWEGGLLKVNGYAHVNAVSLRRRRDSLKVAGLRRAGSRRVRVLPVRTRYDEEATRPAPDARHRYDWAGFSLTVDPRDLRVAGRWQDTMWKPALAVFSRGVLRRGLLPPGPSSRGAYPPYRRVADGVRIVPMYAGGTLRLRVEVVTATVTGHRAADGMLTVEGRLTRPSTGALTLRLRNVRSRSTRDYPAERDGAVWRAAIPLDDLRRRVPAGGDHGLDLDADLDENAWRPELVVGGDTLRPIPDDDMPEGAYPAGERQVVVERTRHGYLSVTERAVRPVITCVSWGDGPVLDLAGRFPGRSGPFELVLRAREGQAERVFPAVAAPDGFGCTLDLHGLHTLAGTPLPAGRWDLLARDCQGTVPVKLDHAALRTLPLVGEPGGRRHVLDRSAYDQLVVEVPAEPGAGERGPYRQVWAARARISAGVRAAAAHGGIARQLNR
ncbi:MAG: glycosyltransferase [Streptosporangiales bacterium]|nr:glycosyltransferase [Streptosporangiales bacterium]